MRVPSLFQLIPFLALPLMGCGSDAPIPVSLDQAVDGANRISRSSDPRLLKARAALEAGRPSTAESLLASLGVAAGVEGPLASARVQLAQGQVIAALAHVEEARAIDGEDVRVFATAAEILALADRGLDAEDQLDAGRSRNRNSPDLARAQAFLELTRPGQGVLALKRLEAALAVDPSLPYCRWPLAQAHLLAGRGLLGSSEPAAAVEQARLALQLEPGLASAEELLGAALAALKQFEPALAALGRAQDLGLDMGSIRVDVHLRAGMAARLSKALDVAEGHYMAIRELGASEQKMGSGLDFLADRGRVAFEEGMAAQLRDEHGAAAIAFMRSLALAPEGNLALDAMDGLAAARFRLKDYAQAARIWADLWLIEVEHGGLAESRTHLNVARARVLAGDFGAARLGLEQVLQQLPEGACATETRDLLAQVPQN